jgi:serine/threonine protein kinase
MQESVRKYERLMKIGEGAYGAVYKACELASKKMVALKVTKFDMEDEGIPSTTLREISILKSLSHPSIVRYVVH